MIYRQCLGNRFCNHLLWNKSKKSDKILQFVERGNINMKWRTYTTCMHGGCATNYCDWMENHVPTTELVEICKNVVSIGTIFWCILTNSVVGTWYCIQFCFIHLYIHYISDVKHKARPSLRNESIAVPSTTQRKFASRSQPTGPRQVAFTVWKIPVLVSKTMPDGQTYVTLVPCA
jgi:hypothetical protein